MGRRHWAICLLGPTATGKTAAALAVARRYPVEIVSVDSALVYRGLDIGAGKPSAGDRAAVPHHLIDIREPWESYSAGDFLRDALALVPAIRARGRVPLLVGGTMLYFRSLFRGLASLPAADPAVRAAIDARAAALGWPALHAELAALDPAAAARIHPADRQRIQRALEVHATSGRPLSAQQYWPAPDPDIHFHRIAVVPAARSDLHGAIAARLRQMLAAGFLEEVARLRATGRLHGRLPAVRAVGYRQLWAHLEGEYDQDEAVRRILAATRQLARRQLTWLRREPRDQTVEPGGGRLQRALAEAIESLFAADAIWNPSG